MSKNNLLKTILFSKAFTLLEIIIVVVILGIIAALGFPTYKNSVEKAKANEMRKMLYVLAAALSRHAVETDWDMTSGGTDLFDVLELYGGSRFPEEVIDQYSLGARAVSSGEGYYIATVSRKRQGILEFARFDYQYDSMHSDTFNITSGPYALWTVINKYRTSDVIVRCADGNRHPGICTQLGF